MDPPKSRKKREASLKKKKKEKGHAYNARHVRISLTNTSGQNNPTKSHPCR